jgi:hypothetical protein
MLLTGSKHAYVTASYGITNYSLRFVPQTLLLPLASGGMGTFARCEHLSSSDLARTAR